MRRVSIWNPPGIRDNEVSDDMGLSVYNRAMSENRVGLSSALALERYGKGWYAEELLPCYCRDLERLPGLDYANGGLCFGLLTMMTSSLGSAAPPGSKILSMV